MQQYFFLQDDYQKLCDQITATNDRIKSIGKDMGASCQEGAETFHDNFAYEDGERQQKMWSQRLRELVNVKDHAKIVPVSPKADQVGIGRIITTEDMVTKERHTFKVASFMTFDDSDAVPYNAPLAKMLIGAKVGDEREGVIAGDLKSFLVIAIQ